LNSNQSDQHLISLVGRDPVSNLLAARFLDLDGNLLIHLPETGHYARRLQKLLPECSLLEINSLDIHQANLQVIAHVDPAVSYQFNLSDGPQGLALISALLWNFFETPLHILIRKGGPDDLYTYFIEDGRIQPPEVKPLPGLLTLEEYLQVWAGGYDQVDPTLELTNGRQEIRDIIFNFVKLFRRSPAWDEYLIGVNLNGPRGEITLDLLVRLKNQVSAVLFRRESADLKRAVELLEKAGQEGYLGSQTQRFLVVNRTPQDDQIFSAAEAKGVSLLTLSKTKPGSFQEGEIQQVIDTIKTRMGQPQKSNNAADR
jgi:hypothetical protein